MIKRILFAIPALLLLVSIVWLHGLYAIIVVALAGVLCMHELMSAASGVSKPLRVAGYAYAALLYPAYEFAGGLAGVAALLTLGVMVVFAVLVFSGRDAADGLFTVLPMVYPGLLFAFLFAILCAPEPMASRFLLIVVFGSAIVTDSFAYFCGRLLGRHKLAEKISPKKTVEGAIGGMLFGTAGVYVLGALLQPLFGVNVNTLWYLPLGLVLSVLAQVGDLAASAVKRRFGIKDFGRIMGEHGGAMDRLDSVLFIAPIVFAFYTIIAA